MNLKIGQKIGLGFGALVVLILIMAVVSYVNLRDAKEDLSSVQSAVSRMTTADDTVKQYKATMLAIRTYVAFGDENARKQVEENFNKVIKLESDLLTIARTEKKKDVQEVIDRTEKYRQLVINEYMPVAVSYNTALSAGNFAQALEAKAKLADITQKALPIAQSVESSLEGLAANNEKMVKDLITESLENASRVILISLLISGVSITLAIGVAVFLTRLIRRPVILITEAANTYASGDLRKEIDFTSSDELGTLAEALRMMRKNFVEMIGNIRASAEQLSASSEEMAASTEEVTSTSEEVSRNMQTVAKEAENGNDSMLEASKSLVHLASLIQIAQSKAKVTANTSMNTRRVADNGRFQVSESVQKMSNIKGRTEDTSHIIAALNEHSKQIEDIVVTITTIANQTNLLALNAAIEAARAGEHGRGFAVVAEEVRKLAEQSNKGAQEITSLIQQVTEKTQLAVSAMDASCAEVESGVNTVNQAGQALDQILDAVEKTVAETDGILDVTNEEVASSEQIVQLINNLATVIEVVASHCQEISAVSEQQSAAMQTVAAGAEETSAMAIQLKNSVEKFHI